MRMAIILKLLSEKNLNEEVQEKCEIVQDETLKCCNEKCITSIERGIKQIVTKCVDGKLRCKYCEHEILKENKLISVEINGKIFKIDLIEQRKPKK